MTPPINRRQWLKATGATLAATALSARLPLHAQNPVSPARVAQGLVQLSLNENPFGPSSSAQRAMVAAVGRSCRYASAEERRLLDMIAEKERCSTGQIVLGSGSGEILNVAGFHFGYEKGEIVAADPCYMRLLDAAAKAGGQAVRVPLNSRLEHDLPAMAAAVGAKTSLVYVVNPNNPTGTVCGAAELVEFVRDISARVPVFIDEAYLECLDDFGERTCAGLAAAGHNVAVARTFSKIYGMAGCRVGYAVMPENLAASLRARMTGSLSLVSIEAAIASLRDEDFVTTTRAKLKDGRDALIAEIKALGRDYAEARGNFVFFKTGMPVQDFIARMRAEGVAVGRPFPPLLDWARISIGLPHEMDACHRALHRVLA